MYTYGKSPVYSMCVTFTLELYWPRSFLPAFSCCIAGYTYKQPLVYFIYSKRETYRFNDAIIHSRDRVFSSPQSDHYNSEREYLLNIQYISNYWLKKKHFQTP